MIDETNVANNTTTHEPFVIAKSTATMEAALNKSHHTIVLFGRQRSANVPPINENMKIGANSATEMSDTAKASPFVISLT
ncbi:hypothetical protein D3C73_862710 [compost metagenome]